MNYYYFNFNLNLISHHKFNKKIIKFYIIDNYRLIIYVKFEILYIKYNILKILNKIKQYTNINLN
jgi:hypothetical protein